MKSFLEHVRYKIQAFMQGRYGMDELSYFLSMTGLTLFLLSVLIRPLSILYFPALAVLIWSWFRSFSKNIYKRREERNAGPEDPPLLQVPELRSHRQDSKARKGQEY